MKPCAGTVPGGYLASDLHVEHPFHGPRSMGPPARRELITECELFTSAHPRSRTGGRQSPYVIKVPRFQTPSRMTGTKKLAREKKTTRQYGTTRAGSFLSSSPPLGALK